MVQISYEELLFRLFIQYNNDVLTLFLWKGSCEGTMGLVEIVEMPISKRNVLGKRKHMGGWRKDWVSLNMTTNLAPLQTILEHNT